MRKDKNCKNKNKDVKDYSIAEKFGRKSRTLSGVPPFDSVVNSNTIHSANVIKTVGQTICDLRALRTTLDRTRKKGLAPIYYTALYSIVDLNLKGLFQLLSVHGKAIDVWVIQLQRFNKSALKTPDLIFIGATELAAWKQLQEWINENWDECMHQACKPGDPTEMVNEFLDHSGFIINCESRPLPFLTSLPEPKKIDS